MSCKCFRAYPMFHLALVGLGAAALITLLSGQVGSQKTKSSPITDGTKVEWEGWRFNWSLRPTEGLVLTDVYYQGRQVLKYAGIAELLTVYDQGEPRILDLSQNGLGAPLMPIVAGSDCSSGEWCRVFDAKGKPPAKGTAPMVMMHEERTGPNYLGQFGRAPGKMLVLWSAGRFEGGQDGYTFMVRWKFRDDGALVPEVGATGVPQHLATGDTSSTGAFIGRNEKNDKVFAPSHIHGFLYRLEFAVDGANNSVEEFNYERDRANPAKARCSWTPIVTETGRSSNPEKFRSWRVVNYASKNALGQPRSYELVPGSTGVFRGDENERATHADLWITVNKPNEMPRSAADPRTAMEALPAYVDGEALVNKNVVLWYWLAFHHFPRAEEWPYQPMVWRSFELMPRDFLDGSPLKPVK